MNKRGQALVEFVIILPVFIMLLLCGIDIGKIVFAKNNLESIMDNVITAYESDKTYEDINREISLNNPDVELKVSNSNNEYIVFTLDKKMDILTPGLNLILGKDYEVEVKRVINYES